MERQYGREKEKKIKMSHFVGVTIDGVWIDGWTY
jgi:hypothetical protein